jgi:hypothetical protein
MPRPTQEQLFAPHLRGPETTRTDEETNPWAGRTSVLSGDATVTVSTALVNSASIIHIGEQVSSAGVAAVQSAGHLVVNSIVTGTSFSIARAGGVAAPWDATAMWQLINPKRS